MRLGQQNLAKAIVDLVAARMVELVALEIDLCAAEMLCQSLGKIERAGAAGIVSVQRFPARTETPGRSWHLL